MNGKKARMLRQMRASKQEGAAFIRLPAITKGVVSKTFRNHCADKQQKADESGRMEWIKPSLLQTFNIALSAQQGAE